MNYRTVASAVLLLCAAISESPAQWTRVPGINEMTYSFTHTPSALYVGADTRVHYTEDGGITWTASALFPDDADGVFALATWGDMLFAGTAIHGVFATSDRGATWRRFGSNDPRRSITTMLVHDDTLFAGTDGFGIYAVSLANEDAWRTVNDGLPSSIAHTINTLHATGTHLVAGAGINGHIYRRAFGEHAWEPVPLDPPRGTITAYSFMIFGDALHAATNAGIFRGPLDASQWSIVNEPALPPMSVVTLTSHQHILFAGLTNVAEFYVAESSDGGNSWGITDHEFLGLVALKAYGGKLYAACEFGLYWRQIEGTSDVPAVSRPESARLETVFPSPLKDGATVGFRLGQAGTWSLNVRDLLGRIVARVAEGYHDEGFHNVPFDTATLPNGVYMLQLETARGVDTRRFTIAR